MVRVLSPRYRRDVAQQGVKSNDADLNLKHAEDSIDIKNQNQKVHNWRHLMSIATPVFRYSEISKSEVKQDGTENKYREAKSLMIGKDCRILL